MKYLNFFVISVLCFFSKPHSYAQYVIQQMAEVGGLSNGTVTSIAKDKDGFIWAGTRNGLSRYDGFEIKTYLQENSNLSGDEISVIYIDSKHRLWIGTIDRGLNLYILEHDSFKCYRHDSSNKESISSDEIRSIHEDTFGNLWIGTKNGLNRLDSGKEHFQRYSAKNSDLEPANFNIIQAISSDSNGNLWIGTFGGGLKQFDYKINTIGDALGGKENSQLSVYSIVSGSENEILVSTRDNGVLSYFFKNDRFFPIDLGNKKINEHLFVRTMLASSNGEVWMGADGIGIDGNGLFKLKKTDGQWESQNIFKVDSDSSVAFTNAIYSLFVDSDRNLWIGTAWKGLKVLEKRNDDINFLYGDLNGGKRAPVWSVYKSDNTLWIGTDGRGLNSFDLATQEITKYNPKKSRKHFFDGEYVHAIYPRSDGKFWVGTYLNGLILFDPILGQVKKHMHDPKDAKSISSNDVQDIISAGDSQYWVATRGGGLNFFDEKSEEFHSFKFDSENLNSISNNNIIDLELSIDNKIWVATNGGGVNLFDPVSKTFRRFMFDQNDFGSISSNKVTCIYLDPAGALWVGTYGKGLNRIDHTTFEVTRFGNNEGLTESTISSVIGGKENEIWVSTKKGIYQYLPDKNYFYPHADLGGEYHFGASFKDTDQNLYFGSIEGVVYFNPDKMIIEQDYPNVKLTGFKLFNKPVDISSNSPLKSPILLSDEMILEHDQSVITLEYAALKFPFSGECRYAIKMEGFDQEWRDNGLSRSATYTNLAPGEYEFKVKTVTLSGSDQSGVASIKLTIKKPYWATIWAFMIYMLVLALLLYLFGRYLIYWEKMKNQLKLEQLQREKETEIHEIKLRFFTNISHEIRTPVTLVLGAVNRLAERGITDLQQNSAIQTIRKNSNHLYNLVNELLDLRKLESGESKINAAKGDLIKFCHEIFLSFIELASSRNIAFQFEPKHQILDVWFDAEEIEKVLYNLISNAFKYTDAGGNITVSISSDTANAYITISDTGKGIPAKQLANIFRRFYQSENKLLVKQEQAGYGLGLAIANDIIKLHEGEILVESALGKGSVFTVKLQLGNGHLNKDYLINDSLDLEEVQQYVAMNETIHSKELSFNYPDYSELTILIAEDNEDIRDYLGSLLSAHFKVILAKNGVEALDLTLSHLPDLVVSDVMMPEMDGVTFASKVKNDPRTSHIPIIILTARTSLIYKKEGLDVGVDDYITKPFSETLLKTRIRNLLHTRALLREKFKTELLIQPSELDIRSPDQEFLNKLSQLLERNIYESEQNNEMIYHELGMSQSSVYKKLKALTGMSVIEFRRDFRLKQAAQLMIKQELTVSEACFRVGLSDRKYFSQVFKTKFGISPSQYRKENSLN